MCVCVSNGDWRLDQHACYAAWLVLCIYLFVYLFIYLIYFSRTVSASMYFLCHTILSLFVLMADWLDWLAAPFDGRWLDCPACIFFVTPLFMLCAGYVSLLCS